MINVIRVQDTGLWFKTRLGFKTRGYGSKQEGSDSGSQEVMDLNTKSVQTRGRNQNKIRVQTRG